MVDSSAPHFLSKLKVRTRSARKHYEKCTKSFLKWSREHGYGDLAVVDPASETVDRAMEKYLEDLFKLRKPLSFARGVLFGWAWAHPMVVLKALKHLPLSAKAIAGWTAFVPGGTRQPWPALVAEWMASIALIDNEVTFAILLLLCFDCYLRPCDAFRLRRENFVPPQHVLGGGSRWTLVMYPTEGRLPAKNNSFDDSVLIGHHRRAWLGKPIGIFLRKFSARHPVFDITHERVLRLIAKYSAVLGLQSLSLSFHGLRHGGPSSDFKDGTLSLKDIQRRGRWKHPASVRRYEKHGLISSQLNRLTAEQKAKAAAASALLPSQMLKVVGRE